MNISLSSWVPSTTIERCLYGLINESHVALTTTADDPLRLYQDAVRLVNSNRSEEAIPILEGIMPKFNEAGEVRLYDMAAAIMVAALNKTYRSWAAIPIARALAERKKENLGLDAPLTLKTVTAYAQTLHRVGDLDEARAVLTDVLPTQSRVLGLDHPDTKSTICIPADIDKEGDDVVGKKLPPDPPGPPPLLR